MDVVQRKPPMKREVIVETMWWSIAENGLIDCMETAVPKLL